MAIDPRYTRNSASLFGFIIQRLFVMFPEYKITSTFVNLDTGFPQVEAEFC